jgi:RNA-binding protein YlmH
MTNKTIKAEAIQELTNILNSIPTDTIYTVLRHVSSSGMQREISVRMIDAGKVISLDWLVATATDRKIGKHNGLVIKGCGMDMGFHLVDSLNSEFVEGTPFRHDWI